MKKKLIKILLDPRRRSSISITDAFPQDNAASTADVNSAGSFYMSDADATVVTSGSQDGTNHVKFTNTATYGAVRIDMDLEIGETYDITIWTKKGVENTTPSYHQGFIGFVSGPSYTEITETVWTEYTWSLVADATTGTFRWDFSSENVPHSLYLDQISVIKQ